MRIMKSRLQLLFAMKAVLFGGSSLANAADTPKSVSNDPLKPIVMNV